MSHDPSQFLKALAITESNDNPAAWGDQGLAMGRWQVHPAWVWDHLCKTGLFPAVRESWNSWIERGIMYFVQLYSVRFTPRELAMSFHLGHLSHLGDRDWDTAYDARFVRNYALSTPQA